MPEMPKKVAVIGAGPSGLTTGKAMLEKGLLPTIFEAKDRIGGLWAPPSPETCPQALALKREMRTNLSKLTCSFSDYFPLENFEMFPKVEHMLEYLEGYQKRFIPEERIRLGVEVTSVSPVSRDGISGWDVEWKKGGEKGSEFYEFLAICSGFFARPFLPDVENLLEFGGSVLHSSEYSWSKIQEQPKKFDKRKILVVGGSLSGAEIAAELALQVSSIDSEDERSNVEIIHLMHRPPWIFPKSLVIPNPVDVTAPKFLPLDFVFYDSSSQKGDQPETSAQEKIRKSNAFLKTLAGSDQECLHENLKIANGLLDHPPWTALSDSYANFVCGGLIKPVLGRLSGVSRQSSNTLILGASSSVPQLTEIDTIIFCTGYHPASVLESILPPDIYQSITANASTTKQESDANILPFLLHNETLHPALGKNAGFVGMYKGPFFGVMELQAKWLAGLFIGSLAWPEEETMRKEIEETKEIRENRRRDENDTADRTQWSWKLYPVVMDRLQKLVGVEISQAAKSQSLEISPLIPSDSSLLSGDEHAKAAVDFIGALLSEVASTPKYVAFGVFRALQGKWKLSRKLRSKLPGFPSGVFTGTAEFRPRLPTFEYDDSAVDQATKGGPSCSTRTVQRIINPSEETHNGDLLEYLYTEKGELITDNGGLRFTATRQYIYRYSPRSDSISVWFVKTDSTTVDYFFHELQFLGTGEEVEVLGEADGVEEAGGWKAKSEHLCVKDMYWPAYRFTFGLGVEGSGRRSPELDKFWIRYKVEGPKKDYVSEGLYERF
ncbi:hypothetical protein RUND412_001658 [Rhizina undulata]